MHKQMMMSFLIFIILNVNRIQAKIKDIKEKEKIHPLLNKLMATKCFSKIKINLDEPCRSKELLHKCTFKACQLPRGEEYQRNQIGKEVCRCGNEIKDICVFYDDQDSKALFVDLDVAKQIYSGYKKGASDIWRVIYNETKNNPTLSKIISGIHFSISVHMSIFYKKFGSAYWSNPHFYRKKRKAEYIKNLAYAFKVVRNALYLLDESNYKCSLEMDGEDRNLIKAISNEIKKEGSFHIDDFYLGDYEIPLKNILDHLNCIECDKCKLWGKIQFKGLASACKIISDPKKTILSGSELINLLHLFHKLGSSILYVQKLEAIKYPLLYTFFLYWVEIITVILSLSIFFLIHNKTRKKVNITKKLN